MPNPKEHSGDATEDLELGAQDAAKVAGGDVKPTPGPTEYVVYTLRDTQISSYPIAP
jgi:hypothetical protein